MTDASANPVAGWYPDPHGAPGALRWWDGTAWSEHVAGSSERTRLPEGTKVDGVWIWLVALLPILSYLPLFLLDFRGYMRASMTGDFGGMGGFWLGYALLIVVGWVLYGLSVFFAYRDYRDLLQAGVVRPFHWAWTFLGALIYDIGRFVILRKVTNHGGSAPFWAALAVTVLGFVVVIAWVVWFMSGMFAELSELRPSYYDYGY